MYFFRNILIFTKIVEENSSMEINERINMLICIKWYYAMGKNLLIKLSFYFK